ncbi:MAG TPA: copper homeostasis protein CutC [Streptosporangiaceae bacterium]|nr:copper homeostasis protein CutC [Streptosporangiaceae bacterium]
MLEVIALDAADALAAQLGGADRLEVVADMAADGLTPDPVVVARIRGETSVPLRVMLRANTGFRTSGPELDRLRRAAGTLAQAGADAFVFGFLDSGGEVDIASTAKLAADIAPLPWTFHRAVDHAADPEAAWRAVLELPGLDTVLTGGAPGGVEAGLDVLIRRTGGPVLAGGGLRRKHVAPLAAAGITGFHVGGAVRPGGSWECPVDAGLVREWQALVSAATA